MKIKGILISIIITILLAALASAETIEVSLEEKYLEGNLPFGGDTYELDVQIPNKLIITNDQTSEIALSHSIQDRYSGDDEKWRGTYRWSLFRAGYHNRLV